jgi:hypothetical protein
LVVAGVVGETIGAVPVGVPLGTVAVGVVESADPVVPAFGLDVGAADPGVLRVSEVVPSSVGDTAVGPGISAGADVDEVPPGAPGPGDPAWLPGPVSTDPALGDGGACTLLTTATAARAGATAAARASRVRRP